MSRFIIAAARVLIALMLLGTLAVQFLVPLIASETAAYAPEFASLRWPMTVLAILTVVCAQERGGANEQRVLGAQGQARGEQRPRPVGPSPAAHPAGPRSRFRWRCPLPGCRRGPAP